MESSSFIHRTGSCLSWKGCSKAPGLVPATVCCWLSPGLSGSLPSTFTQRSPGEGVRAFASASPFPLVLGCCACHEGRHMQLLLQCQVFVLTAGVQSSPPPWGLSTPASAPAQTWGFTQLHIHLCFYFPPPSCERQSQKSVCVLLHLAQPPDLSGWSMPHTCWGLSLGPSICPVSPRPCHGAVAVSGVPVPQPAAQGAVRSMRSVHAGYL